MATEVGNRIENIFAHAVALDQSGGQRNTIYAIGKEIYILNYDHTLLLRFGLRDNEKSFVNPISFRANDYDSPTFYERDDGKIEFVTEQSGFQRRKSCSVPGRTCEDIQSAFQYLMGKADGVSTTLSKDVLPLLERSLSHTEFMGEEGEGIKLVQRNIYDGSVIEVQKKIDKKKFTDLGKLEDDFGPIALKTDDFAALFSFQDQLHFTFPTNEEDSSMVFVESVDRRKYDMDGVIACCLYDEIAQIKEAVNGREE